MNLVAIIVNGQELDLGQDFSVRFSFNMPLPYKSNIPVASTYWFNFPATDTNNIILKHANNLHIAERINSYNCTLRAANILFGGKLLVKDAGKREYKAFVVFNDIIENLAGKQLSECVNDTLDLGADTDAIVATAKTMTQSIDPDEKYAFPQVRDEIFFGDTNADYTANGKIINNYDRNNQVYFKNYEYSGTIYNRYVLIPFPYLLFIARNIFETIGWSISGNLIDDENFKRLVYFNNYALEKKVDENFLQIERISPVDIGTLNVNHLVPFNNALSDELGNFNPLTSIFNCDKTATFYYNLTFNFTFEFFEDFTIYFYIYNGSTYTQIAEYNYHSLEQAWFGYTENAHGSFSAVNGSNYSIYYKVNTNLPQAFLDNLNFYYSPTTSGIDRFQNKVNLKNHVPKLTASEFFVQLAKKFSIAVFFNFEDKIVEFELWNNIVDNNNTLDLTSRVIKDSEQINLEHKSFSFATDWSADEMLEGNFKDISKFTSYTEVETKADLPTAGIINQLCLVKSTNKYYVTRLNTGTNLLEWVASFDNFYNIESAEKEAEPISTIINTLFMRETVVIYPEIKQQGSNTEMGINDQGFKLLNHHGFETNYPYSSNTIYAQDGTELPGVPLQLQGKEGTYERYGKKLYEYLIQNNPVEMDLAIMPADFAAILQIFSAGSKTRKIRIGNRNYLPESVDISVSLKKIENCKLKLL